MLNWFSQPVTWVGVIVFVASYTICLKVLDMIYPPRGKDMRNLPGVAARRETVRPLSRAELREAQDNRAIISQLCKLTGVGPDGLVERLHDDLAEIAELKEALS